MTGLLLKLGEVVGVCVDFAKAHTLTCLSAKEELMTFRKFGSKLQGHPAKKYLPGIETSTGSLGQGLSIGCGIAMGLKLDNNPANVYVLMGDGEEWEEHGIAGDIVRMIYKL